MKELFYSVQDILIQLNDTHWINIPNHYPILLRLTKRLKLSILPKDTNMMVTARLELTI